MNADNKQIAKSWKGNKNKSVIVSLPLSLSKKYNLDKPTYVILEQHHDGILIKKLSLDEEES